MISYELIRKNSSQFQSQTSLNVAEFDELLIEFEREYLKWIRKFTLSGKPRIGKYSPRSESGDNFSVEIKFFFILNYMKENRLQEGHASSYDLSQPMTNKWIHILIPIVDKILLPYRAARTNVGLMDQMDENQDYLADCTTRSVQRDSYAQEMYYDGKKKHIR